MSGKVQCSSTYFAAIKNHVRCYAATFDAKTKRLSVKQDALALTSIDLVSLNMPKAFSLK